MADLELVNGSSIKQDYDEIIQLLDPTIYTDDGTGKFYYDLYMKSTDAGCTGRWTQSNGSGGYVSITGTHGGTAYTEISVAGLGSIYKTGVEINTTNDGLVKADHLGGGAFLDYWWVIRGPGLPTSLQRQGSGTTAYTREFFLHADRQYVFTAQIASGGTFTWSYWDGMSWVAFPDGTDSTFIGQPPTSGRVRIVTTVSSAEASVWSLKALR